MKCDKKRSDREEFPSKKTNATAETEKHIVSGIQDHHQTRSIVKRPMNKKTEVNTFITSMTGSCI